MIPDLRLPVSTTPSRRSGKRERIRELLKPADGGVATTLSGELLHCAFEELRMALEDRKKQIFCAAENHYSAHALASIMLSVASFEAWLNEFLCVTRILPRELNMQIFSDAEVDKVLNNFSPVEKYQAFAEKWTGTATLPVDDLLDAIAIRDEITHHLPRHLGLSSIPARFHRLREKGLFVSHPTGTLAWPQKLASYALAYWVWDAVITSVRRFVALYSPEQKEWLPPNPYFSAYAARPEIRPPDQLKTYDLENKIEVA
jgi:hypothetical protein